MIRQFNDLEEVIKLGIPGSDTEITDDTIGVTFKDISAKKDVFDAISKDCS